MLSPPPTPEHARSPATEHRTFNPYATWASRGPRRDPSAGSASAAAISTPSAGASRGPRPGAAGTGHRHSAYALTGVDVSIIAATLTEVIVYQDGRRGAENLALTAAYQELQQHLLESMGAAGRSHSSC